MIVPYPRASLLTTPRVAPPLDADKPGRVWRETGAENGLQDIALRMLVEDGSPLQSEGVPFLIDERPLTVGAARRYMLVQKTHAAGQRIGAQTIVGVETHNRGGAGQ